MPSRPDRHGAFSEDNPGLSIGLEESIVRIDDSPFRRRDAHVSEQLCAGRLVDQNPAVLRVLKVGESTMPRTMSANLSLPGVSACPTA